MGSSDRRFNTRYCYNYFRLGNAFSQWPLLDRLCLAEFLCESESTLIEEIKPQWLEMMEDHSVRKIAYIETEHGEFLDQVFPFCFLLSKEIDRKAFISSHFHQPDLFIRVKRGAAKSVQRALNQAKIGYQEIGKHTYALSNGSKLQQLLGAQGLFEVQDWSSQQSLDDIPISPDELWWDCCAASGGKSLLLLDRYPSVKLLVSDKRMSILRNLDERFERAGFQSSDYRKKILDLSQPVNHLMAGETFDGILLDAPCSGSGTWGRTPEMLRQFDQDILDRFSALQQVIAKHVVEYLRPGGTLVYITCSVFEQENESAVRYMQQELGLHLINQRTIIGYRRGSDSMFVARFSKS